MFGLSTLATRIALALIAAVLVLGLLQVRSCQLQRQRAAEARLNAGQGKAAHESAKDAIATQGNATAREQASEQTTVTNEKDIRNAKGADVQTDPAVDRAGRRAICLRDDYRDSPHCRMLRADSQ